MNKLFSLIAFSILLLIPVGIQNSFAGAPNCTPPPSGMISWWPGDGNTNDIVDSNPGALQGGAGFVAGKVGQAFNLPQSGYIRISGSPNLEPQQLTVDAWVLATNFGSIADGLGAVIVSKDENTQNPGAGNFPDVSYGLFGPGNLGRFTAIIDRTDGIRLMGTSSNTFALGQFHHVAMTFDGQTLLLYVNGQQEAITVAPGSTIAYDGSDLAIGMHPTFNSRLYAGIIDEVELFNRALSQNEIQTIFNADSAGKCKDIEPEPQIIGGSVVPIETTSLILVGAQSFSWMIPVLLSGIGIGLFVVSRINRS